ncbi:DUF4127 family protein [bacterium]|nr:DUF4127 family protein [bacterium]
MKICVIPIDNRPVCYNLFKDIAAIDEDIELFIPPREFLGDLTKIAEIDKLFDWLEQVSDVDKMVISLDTLAYGGLIPSRRCPETFEQIKVRIEKLKEILKSKKSKIYAFSSIMRISNNNVNQEEKEYWNEYGTKIFKYSFDMHKFGNAKTDVPQEILDDYKNTRKRNFEINKTYLEWQKEGLFDTLVFSKDDCAEFGFNVKEAQELEHLGGFTKTGADEIPLTLFARATDGRMSVNIEFTEPEYKNLISNYEDVSIEKSVLGQLSLANIDVCNEANSDITLIVNNFRKNQGEIVMKRPTEPFDGEFNIPDKNYMIADVRFANGADNAFVEKFIHEKYKDNFYGYSAWNTSANTLGSLLCAAKVKFLAKKYNDYAFKRLQAIRLLDDWAYQANVRQTLQEPSNPNMKNFEKKISEFLDYNVDVSYNFPWNRLFETEVNLK